MAWPEASVRLGVVALSERLDRWSFVLSEEEVTRARWLEDRGREEFIRSHVAVRLTVGSWLGRNPGGEWLRTPAGQKPSLQGSALSISFAHNENLAVVAVGRPAVGVDVECSAAIDDGDVVGLSELILAPAERRFVDQMPRGVRRTELLRMWTRKEAAIKARGIGFDQVEPSGVMIISKGTSLSASFEGGGSILLRDFALSNGALGCLAIVDPEVHGQ